MAFDALKLAQYEADRNRERRLKAAIERQQADDEMQRPATYRGYDADLGAEVIQPLGGNPVAVGRAISNGGIKAGQIAAVEKSSGLMTLDAMPRPRTEQVSEQPVQRMRAIACFLIYANELIRSQSGNYESVGEIRFWLKRNNQPSIEILAGSSLEYGLFSKSYTCFVSPNQLVLQAFLGRDFEIFNVATWLINGSSLEQFDITTVNGAAAIDYAEQWSNYAQYLAPDQNQPPPAIAAQQLFRTLYRNRSYQLGDFPGQYEYDLGLLLKGQSYKVYGAAQSPSIFVQLTPEEFGLGWTPTTPVEARGEETTFGGIVEQQFSQLAGIEAIASFAEAQKRDPNLEIEVWSWRSLCWYGSLHNHAAGVLDACEKAVGLAPDEGYIRDSRGLARALTGDTRGAIADFEAFIA